MSFVELMTVKDTFSLSRKSGALLALHPDFPVPPGGWKNRAEKVLVVRPDGSKIEATAEVTLEHFLIRDPDVSTDKRWRVGLFLTHTKKEDVPLGSRILVSDGLRRALHLPGSFDPKDQP